MSRRIAGVVFGMFLFVSCPAIVRAASRYSLRGEGEPVFPSTADVRALGGAEAASGTPGLASNPASLALQERTRFHGSWLTEWVRTEETLPGRTPVRKEYEGYVPNLGLVFPLPGKLRLGTGLLVERRTDGRIVQGATTPDGQAYQQTFEAKGNLLRIPVLLAREAGPVQLGAGLDVVLKNDTIRWRNDFPDGTAFLDSNDRDETGAWGAAMRAGVRVPLGPRGALGAWGSWPGTLSGSRKLENETPQDSTAALKLDFETGTARRYGVGAEIVPAAGWRVATDWVHEAWNGVDSPLTIGTYVDVDRVSVGLEWAKVTEAGPVRPIRVGFRTEPLHTLDGDGRKIREVAFTAGSGRAFADGRGQFDWFAEYGRRGKHDESEFHEQFVRVGITLTGFEEWTRRRPPETGTDDW